MAASVRAHANLNLYLAERAIAALESGAFNAFWGDHADLMAADTALFRLQLAYRSHLADVCEQKQLTLRPRSAADARALIEARAEFIPEILELAEREQSQSWLSRLVSEDFLPSPADTESAGGVELIARSDGGGDLRHPQTLAAIAAELKEVFARHRETQQEAKERG